MARKGEMEGRTRRWSVSCDQSTRTEHGIDWRRERVEITAY